MAAIPRPWTNLSRVDNFRIIIGIRVGHNQIACIPKVSADLYDSFTLFLTTSACSAPDCSVEGKAEFSILSETEVIRNVNIICVVHFDWWITRYPIRKILTADFYFHFVQREKLTVQTWRLKKNRKSSVQRKGNE